MRVMDEIEFLKEEFPSTNEKIYYLSNLYIFLDGWFVKGERQKISL